MTASQGDHGMNAPNSKTPVRDSSPLEGKHVVFTGRLASMPRRDAMAVVRSRGGHCDRAVSAKTAIVVVGQEGFPLRHDGRLSQKLLAARRRQSLGQALVIQTEEEWLDQLGLDEQSEGIRRRFSPVQLGRLLKIPRRRLSSWIRAALIEPVETIDGVPLFDFRQVANLRTLWELSKSGVSLRRLTRSFERLGRWLPNLDSSATLALLERDGEILVRLDQGLADDSGQLEFDFSDEPDAPAACPTPATPEETVDWLERGIELEAGGDPTGAARAYRLALYESGGSALAAFNLGNVLYSSGQIGAAAERFRQAVEIDHGFVEGWNNLGNALLDLDEAVEAIAAFRQALSLDPDCADAHYNLAETLTVQGRPAEARNHWQAYLRLEPIGDWAAYARRCLAGK